MLQIEKNIKKVLKKSSPFRAWSILFLCFCVIIFAVFLRFFVFSVWEFDGKNVFVCNLNLCQKYSKSGDLVLAKNANQEDILLWLVGKSGDEINVATPFDTIVLNIPKIGDTVVFKNLDPMLWDASAALYKEINPNAKYKTDISLWAGEKEIPFANVGRASISGRPVSENEVAFLPWQELRLLELQLKKIFPAYDSLHFKRRLFADSAEITHFIVQNELFYLSCETPEQKKLCYDSREKGFFLYY